MGNLRERVDISGTQWRFTNGDEPMIFSSLEDPPDVDPLRIYTANNPVSRVDPDGHATLA